MNVRHVFRRGNLLIARAARHGPDEPVGFFCECSDVDCLGTVAMTPRDFERHSIAPGRFVVLPDHEEEAEILAEEDGYAIVVDERQSTERPEVNAGLEPR